MNLKSLAALAATVIATSAWADKPADQKCGAGTCGKKENAARDADRKKPAAAHKNAAGARKDAACSKKDVGCSKKESAPQADAAASKP